MTQLHGHIRYCHTPRDVLRELVQRGVFNYMLSSVKTRDYIGGITDTLSNQNRELLRCLRSDDIATERSMPHIKRR